MATMATRAAKSTENRLGNGKTEGRLWAALRFPDEGDFGHHVGVIRLLPLTIVLAVLLPGLALAAAGSHARVSLADRSPLTVKGTSFKAHERVLVTVTAGTKFVRRVTATQTGAFVARFASTATLKNDCGVSTQILAVGNRGSVAGVKIPGKECPNPPADPAP